MLFDWNKWIWMSSSPFIIFAILLLFTHLLYLLFFRKIEVSIMNGSILMGISVTLMYAFSLYKTPLVIQVIITYELMIVWLYLIFEIIQQILRGESLRNFSERVLIGTWVTATVFSALVLDQAEPYLLGVLTLLVITALIMWLGYIMVFFEWIYRFVTKHKNNATNFDFFFVIATASIIILFQEFFHEDIPQWVYELAIDFSMIIYFICLLSLFYNHVLYKKSKQQTTQSLGLYYSSLAAIGLAGVLTLAIPEQLLYVLWQITLTLFSINMLVKLIYHCWHFDVNLIHYNPLRWFGIFNVAIFYGFTLMFYEQLYARHGLLAHIADKGHYVVILFAILQLFSLFLAIMWRFIKPSHQLNE